MIKYCRIPFDAHLDYHDGKVDSKATRLIASHLSRGCDACEKQLTWIATFVPALAGAAKYAEQSVSEAAFERARRIVPRLQTSKPERELARQRTVPAMVAFAKLLFDSRNAGPAFATARSSSEGSVHSVFRTDAADIDIWQEQTVSGDWFVTGQALSRSGEELSPPDAVSLYSNIQGEHAANFDDSEFSFETVAEGQYALRLHWEELDIVVDDLAVGDAEAL